MVEAQGLPGIPEAPFCPLPQVTGVEAVRPMVWGGGVLQPLLPRPQPLLGSILLINAGSGTRLWFLSLVIGAGMEAG